jgi:hypothetical protein
MHALVPSPAARDGTRGISLARERAEHTAIAHRALRDELTAALTFDPTKFVTLPGAMCRDAQAHQVVLDMLFASGGNAALAELLRIVGLCAQGHPAIEVKDRASAWIAQRATEHADHHHAAMAACMGRQS